MAAEPAAVTSGMPTHEALALLPIPEHLSSRQLQGHVCVWGGEALTTETAVGLGQRRIGDHMAFPRGCRTCVRSVALGALFDHAVDCQDGCRDQPPTCDTGRAWNRVIRLGRR